jgi:tetratricopeptide (TPR) repeat protein
MGKEVMQLYCSDVIASKAKQSPIWQAFLVTLVVTCFFHSAYSQPPGVGYTVPWVQVTTLQGTESNPVLSPDGRWLAFVSDQNGNRDIWATSAAGGVAKQLTTHPSADYSPSWSPDGKGLVFVSTREDAFGDLWWLPVKTSDQDISQSGKPKRLTDHRGKDESPAISPDGTMIAFVSDRAGRDNIWILHRKKGNVEQVTFDGGREPAWLASADSLLYVNSSPNDLRGNLFVAHLHPGGDRNPEPLSLADFVQGFPTVSPDRKEIAWIRITNDTNGDGTLNWSDGSGLWKLQLSMASTSPPVQMTLDSHYVMWPCWGRDGWIYYSSDRGGGVDIWKVQATGPIPSKPTAGEQFKLADMYLAGARASARVPTIQEQELARLCYQKVINEYPDSTRWCAEAWYRISQLYSNQGAYDQQGYILRRILRFYSDILEVASLAEVDYQVLLWDESLRSSEDTLFTTASAALVDNLSRFIDEHPDQIRATSLARLWIANAYFKARRDQRALEEYMALRNIATPPDIAAESQRQIASIFEHFGQGQEIIKSYLRVVTDYPDEVEWNRKAIDRIIQLAVSDQTGTSVVEGLQQIIQRFRNVPNLTAAAQLQIGQELRQQGDVDLALLEFERLEGYRRRYPNLFVRNLSAEARLSMAELYFEKGNSSEAIQWYRRVIDEDGEIAEGRFTYRAKTELLQTVISQGERLEREKDLSLAAAEYRRAIAVDSTAVPAWQGLVRVSYLSGHLNDMQQEIEARLSITPQATMLWYAMGLLLSYKEQTSYRGILESNRWLEGAIARTPTLTPAYVTLGFNYLGLDQMGGEHRRRSFFETMRESAATLSRWITFRQRPPDVDWLERAIDILRTGIALNDESQNPRTEARLLIDLGNAYYQLGEFGYQTAANSYAQGLRLYSTFSSAQQEALVRERFGHCLLINGKYEESAKQLTQARNLYVKSGDAQSEWRLLLRLGELYTFSSDFDNASEIFKDISSRVDRVGKIQSRELWLRNIAQQNLELKDWQQADRFAAMALVELDSADVYRKTTIKNYLKFKILGVSIPLFNFGRLGTGTSKAEGFSVQDEWELNLSIRELAALGRKDYQSLYQVVARRLKMAEYNDDVDVQAQLNYQLGVLEFRLADYELAQTFFRRCTQLSLDHSALPRSPYGAMRSMIARGNLLLSSTDADQSDSTSTATLKKQISVWETDMSKVTRLWNDKVGKISQDHAVLTNLHASLSFRQFLADCPTTVNDAVAKWESAAQVESQFLEALSVAQETRYREAQAVIRHNLGVFYMETGDLERASEHLEASYQIAVAEGLTEIVWRTEIALVRLRMLYDALKLSAPSEPESHTMSQFLASKTADQWMHDALGVMESIPVNPENFEEQVGHRRSVLSGYEMSMDAELTDNLDEVSFLDLAERRSAMEWMWAAGIKPFAVKQETQKFIWGEGGGNAPYLQKELERLSAEIRAGTESEKPDRRRIESLMAQRQEDSVEYQELLDKVWAEDPEFGSLFSLRTASVAEVQAAMDSEEAILRVVSRRGERYLWIILPDTIFQYHTGSEQRFSSRLFDKVQTWSVILDPDLLPMPLDSLTDAGIWFPLTNVSRIGDFRSYLVAKSKRELPGNQGIILYQSGDNVSPDSLPSNWKAIDTREAKIDAIIEAMSSANIICFDLPVVENGNNVLASYFDLGSDRLYFSRLFSVDLSAACALVRWDNNNMMQPHRGMVLNALVRSLMFSGVPSIVTVPADAHNWETVAGFGQALLTKSAAQILTVDHETSNQRYRNWMLFGSHGMNGKQAAAYAQENFKRAILKGNLNLTEGNTIWATRYYRRARHMALALGQESVLHNIDALLLKSANDGKRWGEAEEIQKRLLEQAQKSGDQAGILQAWKNLSYYRTLSKDLPGALEGWGQVLELADASGDLVTEADAHLSRSDLYRLSRNEGAALAEVAKAYQVSIQSGNRQLVLTSLAQKAKVQLEFDDIDSAMTTLTDAEMLLDSIGTSESTASLAVSIFEIKGRIFATYGQYSKAISYTQRALQAAHDSSQIGYLTQRMADLYWESGKLKLATVWAARADTAFQRSGDKSYQLLNQNTRSLIALSQGDRDQAVMLAGTALELATDLGDSANVATITRNLGLIELESGKTDQAILRFKEARQLDQSLQRASGLAHDVADLGLAFLQNNQIDSALSTLILADSLGQSISDRRPLVKALMGLGLVRHRLKNTTAAFDLLDQAQNAIGDRIMGQYLWRVWYYRGQIYRDENQPSRALEAFQRAIDLLHNDPVASGNYQPTGLPGYPEDPFDLAVETALAMHDPGKALLVSDQRRRWLRDQPFQLEGLSKPYSLHQVVNWDDIQSMIHHGTVLLAYHVTPDTAFMFLASDSGLSYKIVPGGGAALDRLVNELHTGIQKLLSVEEPSRKLYQLLLSPVESMLASADQVIIMPSGSLWSVPFCALVDDDGRMVVDRFPVVYLTGLDRLGNVDFSGGEPPQGLLAMAYPQSDQSGGELIFADREIRRIELLNPTTSAYIDTQADEAVLDTMHFAGQSLHFACHGWSAPYDVLSVGILLGKDDRHDGIWQSREISAKSIGSPLVFLNLCPQETELGNPRQRTLSQAFFAAGCRAVISPMWDVDDLAAAVSAKLLYAYRRSTTGSVAETLRQMQLGVRDKVNSHPAYWAGYALRY